MGLQIAMVKIKKGVLGHMTPKPYAFINPIEDLQIGDYVIVEVSRKTARKNNKNDFKVGKIVDFLNWDEGTISQMRPYSFVVSKIDCDNFEKRCTQVKNHKYSLWARYNALDGGQPNKKTAGVPMNVFDRIIDQGGIVHFDRLNSFQQPKRMKKKNKKEKK